MNNILKLMANCFNFLSLFIFLFPIIGFIYFIRKRNKQRFILFLGILLITGIKLILRYSGFLNFKFSHFFTDYFYNLIILFGYLFVFISFVMIVKNDLFNFDRKIYKYLRKFTLFKTIYFLGLGIILIGFTLYFFNFATSAIVKPFFVLNNYFISLDCFIIFVGTILFLIGLLGTLLKTKKLGR